MIQEQDKSIPQLQLPIIAAVLIAIYIAANIFADILSVKIITLPLGVWFNEVDAGTIIYPLAFVVRDMLHKSVGKRIAAAVVVTTALINIFMVLLFQLVAALPAAEWWAADGMQDAFVAIIVPATRIAFASVVAETLSGLTSTYIFSRVIKQNPHKKDILASILSNLFAIILDTIIFALVAFSGYGFPLTSLISIIVVNIIFKVIVALVGSPLVRLIKIRVNPDLL